MVEKKDLILKGDISAVKEALKESGGTSQTADGREKGPDPEG